MSSGIRATVEFATPMGCPIVDLSETRGVRVASVDANVSSAKCASCVTEFSVVAERDLDREIDEAVTPLFSQGSTRRYRYTHTEGVDCPCECLGALGCSVARYVARDGTLTLVFYAADYRELRAVVGTLRDRFPEVEIQRFVRGPSEDGSRDEVRVDRGKLTERQLEVLETAATMGYFERPRRSNATEIAAELDVTPATFREHLAAAQSKILESLL